MSRPQQTETRSRLAAVAVPVGPDAAEVLAAARAERAAEQAAAARQLELAATWADLHPPESIHDAAVFSIPGSEHEVAIAGPGCPLVAEFCVAELGSVLGVSTTAAKKLMGHALELRHRLPRLWAAVHAQVVPTWRARAVAEATIHASPALTKEAVTWVDRQVAAVAGRVGAAQLERLIQETIVRHALACDDPTKDPVDGWRHIDERHVTIDHGGEVGIGGTIMLSAELDIADALDLEHTITQRAATMKALGSTNSLDARRAMALGELARTQTSLDLTPDPEATPHRSAAARQLVLHIHLSAAACGDGRLDIDALGRLEEGQRLMLLDQVKGWCADSLTQLTIKPVIDLNTTQQASGYAIPERIRDHVVLRDGTCVFPWCTRAARNCQIDHVRAYDHDAAGKGQSQPGPTSTDNLAALCTYHHRLKTHSGWTYQMTSPGVFEWVSPHGHRFTRAHDGGTSPIGPANQSAHPPDRD